MGNGWEPIQIKSDTKVLLLKYQKRNKFSSFNDAIKSLLKGYGGK